MGYNRLKEDAVAIHEQRGPATSANIGGHPIHPMLVPFPIAFLIGVLVCDIVYAVTGSVLAAQIGFVSLAAGIIGAAAAAVAGFTDFFGNPTIRAINHAWHHMIGNLIAVVLALINLWLRYRSGAAPAVLPWGLVLSLATGGLLVFTGWRGGDLVYRWAVGVHTEE